MSETKRPVNVHKAYHAHVYFDDSTIDFARSLCGKIREVFDLRVGTLHPGPVGPHPMGSCQVIFGSRDFEAFVEWLERNRGNLTVLVHGLTGDDYQDHTAYAYWLGDPKTLNRGMFEK